MNADKVGSSWFIGVYPRSSAALILFFHPSVLSILKPDGTLGFGAIGKEVAKRLRGWNCKVAAYDPVADRAQAEELGVELRPFDTVVSEADFLSLHAPLVPETRQMVNAAFLRRMKKGAFLINTARGELVDETALLEALSSGRLRGAGLDALSEEPPSREKPVLQLPQVLAISRRMLPKR